MPKRRPAAVAKKTEPLSSLSCALARPRRGKKDRITGYDFTMADGATFSMTKNEMNAFSKEWRIDTGKAKLRLADKSAAQAEGFRVDEHLACQLLDYRKLLDAKAANQAKKDVRPNLEPRKAFGLVMSRGRKAALKKAANDQLHLICADGVFTLPEIVRPAAPKSKAAPKKNWQRAAKAGLLASAMLVDTSLTGFTNTPAVMPSAAAAANAPDGLSIQRLEEIFNATCKIAGPTPLETLDLAMEAYDRHLMRQGAGVYAREQWVRDAAATFADQYRRHPDKFAQARLTPYEAWINYLATAHPESGWNTRPGNPLSSARGTVHLLSGTVEGILLFHPDMVRSEFGGRMPDPAVRADPKIAPLLWLLKVAIDRRHWESTLDATARRLAGENVRDAQGNAVPLRTLLAYARRAEKDFNIYHAWVAGLNGSAKLALYEYINPQRASMSILGAKASGDNPGLVRLNGKGRLLTAAETNRELRSVRFNESHVTARGVMGREQLRNEVDAHTLIECTAPLDGNSDVTAANYNRPAPRALKAG